MTSNPQAPDDDRPPLDTAAAMALAVRYQTFVTLSGGDRPSRLASDAHVEAFLEVSDRVRVDPDPLGLLDALVVLARDADDGGAFAGAVGAGPVEDVLTGRPELWPALAERCRASDAWADTVRGAWVDPDLAASMPAGLGDLVIRPSGENDVPGEPVTRRRPARDRRARRVRRR